MKFTDEEKIQYSKYIIRMLLPFLKQFNEKQTSEKQIEANIQGVFLDFEISVALSIFLVAKSRLGVQQRNVNLYDHCLA